jgi:hypothetical protein
VEDIANHSFSDGKADYVWTRALDGAAFWYKNNYPNLPTWLPGIEIAGGVGTSGATVRYAKLQSTGRASYVAVNPTNGAIAAWLNGCDNLGAPNGRREVLIMLEQRIGSNGQINKWKMFANYPEAPVNICNDNPLITTDAANPSVITDPWYPPTLIGFAAFGHSTCVYSSDASSLGSMACQSSGQLPVIVCTKDPNYGETTQCGDRVIAGAITCRLSHG